MTTPSYRDRWGYLPAVLVTVVEAAGDEVMLRLVSACRGREITVPARDDHVESSVLGQAIADPVAAYAVVHALRAQGYSRVAVPMLGHAWALQRRRHIEQLRRDGATIAAIAQRVGMTERGVWAALARARAARPDSRQLTLFGD